MLIETKNCIDCRIIFCISNIKNSFFGNDKTKDVSINEKRCFDNWYSQNGGKIEREKVLSVECTNEEFIIKTNKNQINTKTVIAANGAKRKKLNVIGENDFIGRGISRCAQCDVTFFKAKKLLL